MNKTEDYVYDLYKLYIPLELEYYRKEYSDVLKYEDIINRSQKSAMKRAVEAALVYVETLQKCKL